MLIEANQNVSTCIIIISIVETIHNLRVDRFKTKKDLLILAIRSFMR